MSPQRTPAPEMAAPERTWLGHRERGSSFAITSLVVTLRILGRTGITPILWGIALYYTLLGRAARRGSEAYLEKIFGEAGFRRRFRHILTFVRVSVDRTFLVRGYFDRFEFSYTGREHIRALAQARRGAILVGAHLGSFEAMRAASRDRDVRLNLLVHTEHARRINDFLDRLDPELRADVIEIHPGRVGHVFEVQRRLEAGELVGILADRVGLGAKEATVRFLGTPARFPTGPFALAATLGCPVYLTFGLFRPPRRYDLFCEPFVDVVELPRRGKEAALAALAQRYAQRLEHYCRLAPYNWFNYYDFWGSDGTERPIHHAD